jgi:hypothetical protein
MASPKLFRVPIGGDLAVRASRAFGRSVVRKFLVLIEAGRIAVELPTGDRVERIGRLPGLIQRFVFPGGLLPSKTFLRDALERADLKIVAAENFGERYALTLREWRRRFLEKWPQGRTARLRRAVQAALRILPLLLRGWLPIWHDRCRPLFNSASSCLS